MAIKKVKQPTSQLLKDKEKPLDRVLRMKKLEFEKKRKGLK